MYCILFNGPPGSGKDTAAAITERLMYDEFDMQHVLQQKFSAPLKRATHELFGLTGRDHNAFEESKDARSPLFMGYSPRECYIAMSEQFAKPQFGPTFFGKVALNELEALGALGSMDDIVIFSDSGFFEETYALLNGSTDRDHFLIMQLQRNSKNFADDSRGYINRDMFIATGKEPYADRLADLPVDNNGTIEDLRTLLKGYLAAWLTQASNR